MLAKKKVGIGKYFDFFLKPIARFGFRPNHLTLFGLFTAITATIISFFNFGLSIILFVTAFILDVFDGAMARSLNMCTDLGEYLDATVDKVVEVLFFFSFAVHTQFYVLSLLALGFSSLIAYFKHRSDKILKQGKTIHSVFDRAERLILMIITAFVYQFSPINAYYLLCLFIAVSVVSLVQIFKKVVRQIKTKGPKKKVRKKRTSKKKAKK